MLDPIDPLAIAIDGVAASDGLLAKIPDGAEVLTSEALITHDLWVV